jgi:DNA invertase Pin-like site-specific DNA recombinase
MSQHIAIYFRVSEKRPKDIGQMKGLKKWAAAQDEPVVWYQDVTGPTAFHPGWNDLEDALEAGQISTIVVYRRDLLVRRSISDLVKLFEDLISKYLNLIILKNGKHGFDLSTEEGREILEDMRGMVLHEEQVWMKSLTEE